MRRIPLTLGTSELSLRKLLAEDTDPIRAWLMDPSNLTAFAGGERNPQSFLPDTFLFGPDSRFSLQYGIVLENGARLIGLAGLYAIDWTTNTAEIGLMIGDIRYRGRGYGTRVVHLLTRTAADDLRITMISAHVLPGNSAASRCFQKAGYHFAGDDRWIRKIDPAA